MQDLAPHITRQRLLLEGYYSVPVDRESVSSYLAAVAKHLGLRAYGDPVVHSPSGAGKQENQGFDAFIPLIDSGISLYVWSSQQFFSALLYSCKRFDEAAAVSFTKEFFGASEVAHRAF